ncbi:type I-B CRISPR-associated protein Cas7/Cst2/DevR [Candidatus Bathyarchaeota archaeon]|nr:type I-B CRISPR-associated protein Cas7/Cst2/DevR [Candidatus Bathyarchaeota archaeon]
MEGGKVSKGIEIVTLTRIEGANLNSNGTEGVISVLKKIRDPLDMKEYVRVSGQSLKFHLKEVMRDALGEELSPISKRRGERGEGSVLVSEGKPEKYIDDDLFGYMLAGKPTLKRTAPVRTNGLISLFPYQEDRDFGVRYDPSGEEEHNIHETEISTNIMRGNFFIEVDRVGVFVKGEVEKPSTLDKSERERRIRSLFEAILTYHGGGHLSRFFTKVYPEAVVVVFLKRKIPIVGDNLRLRQETKDGKYFMDVPLLSEVLKTFEEYIDCVYIGILENKFANLDEIKSLANDKIHVMSLRELKEALKGQPIV